MILSVVIPVYNCEKYIRQCLYSVVKQPCANEIQVIVVDDGSKDRSRDICDEIANKYDNITVIHKENGGVSSARNTGIEKAKGEYIAFLDGDDWWEENFFDKDILEELKKGYDIYGFSFNHISGERYYKKSAVKTETKKYDKDSKGKCDYRFHWSYLYRLGLLKDNNILYPIGAHISEDMVFLEKCFYFVRTYRSVDKVMYNYRKNPDSICHSINWLTMVNNVYDAYTDLKNWYDGLGEEYNFDGLCGMIFSTILDDLCGENTYSFCKNYINTDIRFQCIKNYETIGIPPYYYPKVKHFMEHTFLFWLGKKIKYKVKTVLITFAEKFKFLLTFYEYIVYRKIRGYGKLK